MNRFSHILCLVLALLLSLTLVVACSEDTPDEGGETPVEDTEPVEEQELIDLSQYTLMRADYVSRELQQAFGQMRSIIKEISGAELLVGTDYVDKHINNRAEYEIIVGHTNIPEENAVYETLSEGEYIITVEGTKILVLGLKISNV